MDDIYPLKFEKTHEATVQTLNRLIPAKPISQIFLQVHYNCYDYQWALEQFLKAFFVVYFQQIDLSLRFCIYVTLDSLLMMRNQPSSNSGAGTVIAFSLI